MQANFEGVPTVLQPDQELILRYPPPPSAACLGQATEGGSQLLTLLCEYDARSEAEARVMYKQFASDIYACRPRLKPLASDGTMRPQEVEHVLAKNRETREGWSIAIFHRPGGRSEWQVEIAGVAKSKPE